MNELLYVVGKWMEGGVNGVGGWVGTQGGWVGGWVVYLDAAALGVAEEDVLGLEVAMNDVLWRGGWVGGWVVCFACVLCWLSGWVGVRGCC